MTRGTVVQATLWLMLVALVGIALVVGHQRTMTSYETWVVAQFVALLSTGVIDWGYVMVGRAVTAGRMALAARAEEPNGPTFLVASRYRPMWLLTLLAASPIVCLFLLVDYALFLPLPSTVIIAIFLVPLVLRSRHWGVAHFMGDGVSVVWDDGVVTRLHWLTLPDLGFLCGELPATQEEPSLARRRQFQLVGVARQRGVDAARGFWERAHAGTGDSEVSGR